MDLIFFWHAIIVENNNRKTVKKNRNKAYINKKKSLLHAIYKNKWFNERCWSEKGRRELIMLSLSVVLWRNGPLAVSNWLRKGGGGTVFPSLRASLNSTCATRAFTCVVATQAVLLLILACVAYFFFLSYQVNVVFIRKNIWSAHLFCKHFFWKMIIFWIWCISWTAKLTPSCLITQLLLVKPTKCAQCL